MSERGVIPACAVGHCGARNRLEVASVPSQSSCPSRARLNHASDLSLAKLAFAQYQKIIPATGSNFRYLWERFLHEKETHRR